MSDKDEKNISIENTTENVANKQKPICFVIMPISNPSSYEPKHFDLVYTQIFKPAIEKAGYIPKRVDEDHISDSIIFKIFDYIQNSPMALCDLSSRNPNVLYELGLRQAYDLPVVLVQDDKTDKIFDVGGINTIPYSSDRYYENVIDARENIIKALTDNAKDSGHYSLVKIINAQKASLVSSPVSTSEIINYKLLSIQNEIKSLKDSLKTPMTVRNSVRQLNLEELGQYDIVSSELNIRDTINQSKALLNRLKKIVKISFMEYNECLNKFENLQSAVKGADLPQSTYNHFKSLFCSIQIELNRLLRTSAIV